MIVPIVVRAFAEKKDPIMHTSDVTSVALVAPHVSIEKSTTVGTSRISQAVPDTSGIRAFTETDMLAYIKQEESRGDPTAQNPTSSAYGLFGFLDSTWRSVGCTKTSDPIEQERCAILYMKQRYGSIEGAYYHHLQNDWY